jgi:MFS family permease
MLANYRAAFRPPGVLSFSAAAFVMRAAIAMYPIGLVLLISVRTGHYTFAGLLSGVYVFANGIGNPVLGRLVDKYGQSRALLPTTALHVAGVITIVALAEASAPDWTLILPTVVAGFFYLAVGSLVRARWSYVLAGRPELSTGYSIESTLDEVIFTVGPLLTTVLATQVDPVWSFVLAAALVTSGAVWLQRQRGTEPPAHPVDAPRHASALRSRGMVLVTVAAAAMGAMFAGAEVSMVAFCGQHGHTGLAGVTLGCLAAGSAVAGFVYGARPRPGDVIERFRRQSVVFAVLPFAFLAAVSIPVLAVTAFVVGTCIAPLLITAFGLVEQLVPSAALTEGMAWLTMGLSIGYGIASSVAGRIADAHGARPAFATAIGAGVLVGAIGLAVHTRVRRAPDRVEAMTARHPA